MKTLFIIAAVLFAVQLASAWQQPLLGLKNLEGKTIRGRTLPPAFFAGIDNILNAAESSENRKRQEEEEEFSQACKDAINAVASDPRCEIKNGTDPDPLIICEGPCTERYNNIEKVCTGAGEEGNIGALFGFLTDAICLKDDDGTYCYPVFKKLDTLGDELTAEKLETLCTPCFWRLINVLFANPLFKTNTSETDVKNINAFLDIMCTRADGQWCILTMEEKFCDSGEGKDTDTNCLMNNLNTLCADRCFKKILAKLYIFADPNTKEARDLDTFLKFACIQDGSDYCLVRWADSWKAFNETCSEATLDEYGCGNATCKTELGKFVDTMQCCLQTYIDFVQLHGTPEDANGATEFEQGIQADPCNYELEPACPARTGNQNAEKKFFIRMTWWWAVQNSDEVRDRVRRDIAGFLGVPVDYVQIVTFGKDNEDLEDEEAGVVVEFNARGQTDRETNAFSNDFDVALDEGNLNLPLTAQAYSGQGVLTTAKSATDGGVSGSASLCAMAALTGAAAVVAAL